MYLLRWPNCLTSFADLAPTDFFCGDLSKKAVATTLTNKCQETKEQDNMPDVWEKY